MLLTPSQISAYKSVLPPRSKLPLVAEHRGNMTMDHLVKGELGNVVFALAWWAYLETSDRSYRKRIERLSF